MHEIRLANSASPTREIYWILKPYWRGRKLDDQHWVYIVSCLRQIETRCAECKEEMIIKAI